MKEKLTEGTKIGIGLITPSAPAPALFPERFKRGVSCLENMGFNVKLGKYVSTKNGMTAATAIERATDINEFFADDDVSLLMASIGGDYSAEILRYLDWKVIQANKKGLIGYSDITILLLAIGIKAQQIVYYGPTLMTEFAEYPIPPHVSKEAFLKIFDENSALEISPCRDLLDKGSDWALPPIERTSSCPVFQKTIRPGCANGIVIGGCLEALERIRGTEYFPNFKNAIFIMETVNEEFDEKQWRAIIADYTNLGVFKDIEGIVIGQKTWNEDEVNKLTEMLLDATKEKPIPIVYGLPFGHISPIATIPLFTRATLDADTIKLTYNNPLKYEYIGG